MPPQVIKVTLSGDAEARLKTHLKNRIMALRDGLRELHEVRIPRWRKTYKAVPSEAIREFPFYRASNLVVPIVAIHTDTLQARILAAIFKTIPLWAAKVLGSHNEGNGEELRQIFEDFMQYVGIEPTELDLYRVEQEWFGEIIKFGTGVVKAPLETIIEDVPVSGDGTGQKLEFMRNTVYEGPRPEKIPLEDFYIPPAAKTLEAADIKIHRRRLLKHELEERRFLQFYDPHRVSQILNKPDRTSPIASQQQKEAELGAKTIAGYGYAEWDIYECWLRYRVDDKHIAKVITTYHLGTDTLLRAIYDYYPTNLFAVGRLILNDDMFHGSGFCEILEGMQEEGSQIHNGRRDNQTVANTRVWRVNEDSKLHQGYRIYPSAMLPAAKDEIEPMAHGEVGQITVQEEQITLDLAERRSGVSPPQQGFGAGVMHGRRGVYTAMGTLSMIQEGNRRSDMNITDMRYAHTKLGRILAQEYAHFGLGDRPELFGAKAEKIREAFEAIKAGTIGLPIYASTASVNKEVEKQNDLMLVGVMTRHYQMIAQLIQGASSMMTPEEVKKYLKDTIIAANTLMKSILRDFDKEDTDRLVPEVKFNEQGQPTPTPEEIAALRGSVQ